MGVAGDTNMKCRGTRHVYSSHEIAFLSKNEITVQVPPTKEGVSELLQKLKQIDVGGPMMDGRFQFEGQYVLKTFSCCRLENQWNVCLKGVPIFHANIQIEKKPHV